MMRRIALAMGGLLAVQAHSQDDSWEKIRQGLLLHPGLDHARKMLEERRAEVQWAGRVPVPRLELELENFAGSGGASGFSGSSLGAWAVGDYRLGDVRGREKDLAAADVSLQALDTLRARRELLVAARGVWEEWRRERWMAGLLDSMAVQANSLVEQSEKGRKVGRIGPWEVSMALAEGAQWHMRSAAHRQKAKVLWSRLAAWGGVDQEPDQLPDPIVDTSRIIEGLGMDSVVLEAERTRTQVQAALLVAQDRPVLSGAVGVLRDQSTGDVGLGLRVSLPLPPWKRTGIETVRSKNQAVALERRIVLAARERQIRRVGLHGDKAVALANLRSWESKVIPARELGLDQVEASHAIGAVDASAVWAVRKELWEARIERLEMMIRVLEIQRELEILEGIES
jgi:cobalt-zinc-cadmium efflux system outer membrane protein